MNFLHKPAARLSASLSALALIGAVAASPTTAQADPIADFYKGKTVTIIVAAGPGGNYSVYSLLLAPYWKKYMPGKMSPYKPEEWQDVVTKAVDIMNENYIWPLATFIVGLPDETEEDTIATLELVDKLKRNKMFYVPLLFTSEDECMLKEARHMDLKHLTPTQWELLATCWRNNIEIFADGTQWSAKFGAMLAYVLYYRWKHGRKALQPLMKLAGMAKDGTLQRSF